MRAVHPAAHVARGDGAVRNASRPPPQRHLLPAMVVLRHQQHCARADPVPAQHHRLPAARAQRREGERSQNI